MTTKNDTHMRFVHEFLSRSAGRTPDKTALVCADRRYTYGQLNESARRVATALVMFGLKPHDRVVLYLENSVESVVAIFGILKAGGTFVVVNPNTKAKKLGHILNDSGAMALIASGNKCAVVADSLDTPPPLRCIVWVKGDDGMAACRAIATHPDLRTCPWEDLLVDAGGEDVLHAIDLIDVDLATIIYTSGSTGVPKGVMSAHHSMVSVTRSIASYLRLQPDDIILNMLPLAFDYGLYQIIMAFYAGATVVLEKSFAYPYRIVELLETEKITGLPLVPTIAVILMKLENSLKNGLPHLRYITNTGDTLPIHLTGKLRRIFPATAIYSMFGLTECKRVSYLDPAEIDNRPASVGKAIPNARVSIVDDHGNRVGPHEVGELVVRGDNVMQGYWRSPEETARVFKPDAATGGTVLHTRDLFKMDEDGFLYFMGRKDDIIKTKGERVSPLEIESFLRQIDGVVQAAVIGVPDEIAGHIVKAFVVLDRASQLTEEKILKTCQQHLEVLLVPQIIEFRDTLPTSDRGKIDKTKLI